MAKALKPLALWPEIEPRDYPRLKQFLTSQTFLSCELAPANLCMWQAETATRWLDLDTVLLFYAPSEAMIWGCAQHGQALDWQYYIEQLAQVGIAVQTIYDVPFSLDAPCLQLDGFDFVIDEGNFDYLYNNAEQSALSGGKLRKKRNLVKQFANEYAQYKLVPITADNTALAREIALDLNRRLPEAAFIADENIAMEQAWQNWELWELHGLILMATPDEPAGFSVWSYPNLQMADIHYEKARHDLKGASQFLTRAVAEVIGQAVPLMNREQDLGNAGIRQAKQSLAPCQMYRRGVFKRR